MTSVSLLYGNSGNIFWPMWPATLPWHFGSLQPNTDQIWAVLNKGPEFWFWHDFWGCMSDLKQYSDLLLGHVTNPYCYRVTLESGQLSQFGKLNRGISKAFQVPHVVVWTSFGTWRQGQCMSDTLFFIYKNLSSVRGKLIASSTFCFCPILFLATVWKTCVWSGYSMEVLNIFVGQYG